MQARAGIREVHFFPFNPVDKRTALTYIDADGIWHRASKGAPEQVDCYSWFGTTVCNTVGKTKIILCIKLMCFCE